MQGKVAIVTGGTSGFGAGAAKILSDRGASVWITGRDAIHVEKAAQDLGVHGIAADATSSADWDLLFDSVLQKEKRLDILVNNAGGGICVAPLDEQPDDLILQSISLNLTSKILGCKRAAKVMKAQRSGIILNVSSVCAQQSWPGWATYSAAKAGVVHLSRCLYTELREYNVRVTTVIPSWGATKFNDSASLDPFDAGTLAKCIKPEEFGDLIAYIVELPVHLEMQEITLIPTVQKIEPL